MRLLEIQVCDENETRSFPTLGKGLFLLIALVFIIPFYKAQLFISDSAVLCVSPHVIITNNIVENNKLLIEEQQSTRKGNLSLTADIKISGLQYITNAVISFRKKESNKSKLITKFSKILLDKQQNKVRIQSPHKLSKPHKHYKNNEYFCLSTAKEYSALLSCNSFSYKKATILSKNLIPIIFNVLLLPDKILIPIEDKSSISYIAIHSVRPPPIMNMSC